MTKRTRFAQLCATTTSRIVQRQEIYSYNINDSTILEIVDIYNDLIHKCVKDHLDYYRDECEECGDDDAKEIVELLKDIKRYDNSFQMNESYEGIRYRIDLAGVRGQNDIMFSIYDNFEECYVEPEDPEQDYHFGMTYRTVGGFEAVNIRVGDDTETIVSIGRVKGDEEY